MKTVYICDANWESMLTCIYEAWTSKKGHNNIKLVIDEPDQYSMFEEYIHVSTDVIKAQKVMDAINLKISPYFYNELAYVSMSYDEEVLDTIYRVLLLGFRFGNGAMDMLQYEPVMKYRQLRKNIGNEVNHFQEFLRFHKVGDALYVAHIEPKSRLIASLGPIFQDRMPSENWLIVDDVHKEAVVHKVNEPFYIWKLTDNELEDMLKTEKMNDEYTDMWIAFFNSVAIKERENKRCQDTLFPKWTRKHVVEFLD